jgi:hypothetical protein
VEEVVGVSLNGVAHIAGLILRIVETLGSPRER